MIEIIITYNIVLLELIERQVWSGGGGMLNGDVERNGTIPYGSEWKDSPHVMRASPLLMYISIYVYPNFVPFADSLDLESLNSQL